MLCRAAGFDKSLRLLKPAQFKHTFEQRQSAHNQYFGIYVAKNQVGKPRLGLVVSKKVSKKAVVRNHIKRQVREIFRSQQATLGAIDFVVIAKTPLGQVSKQALSPLIQNLWQLAIKRCKK